MTGPNVKNFMAVPQATNVNPEHLAHHKRVPVEADNDC